MQDAFESFMDAQARELGGDWFDGKIAGGTFKNADGSCRQAIARTLSQGDKLELRPEPENRFDKNAVAVFTAAGEQVGYLEARLAAEVTRRLAKGVKARCFVRAAREDKGTCGVSFALAESQQICMQTATKAATNQVSRADTA